MYKKLFVSFFILSAIASYGQDRSFARTYTSTVLPKGGIDLEFWHTSRLGHQNQFYHAQDQRMELEVGLGKNLQTAFYFNRFQERFSTGANETETKNEIGISNEWKWRLANPYTKKFGVALYGEWGIKGGDELELETKLILDKIFGKHLFAFNAVLEYEKEFEWENNSTHSEGWSAPIEFDLAYMYNLKPSFGIGFEIVNSNGRTKSDGWKYSALFGGPTLNFTGNNFFVIVNYLPQWGNLHKTALSQGSKVLDEHERTEAKVLIGISL